MLHPYQDRPLAEQPSSVHTDQQPGTKGRMMRPEFFDVFGGSGMIIIEQRLILGIITYENLVH